MTDVFYIRYIRAHSIGRGIGIKAVKIKAIKIKAVNLYAVHLELSFLTLFVTNFINQLSKERSILLAD